MWKKQKAVKSAFNGLDFWPALLTVLFMLWDITKVIVGKNAFPVFVLIHVVRTLNLALFCLVTVTVKLSLSDNPSPKQCSAAGDESSLRNQYFHLSRGCCCSKTANNCGNSSNFVQHVSVWDTLTKIQGDVVQYVSRMQVLFLQSFLWHVELYVLCPYFQTCHSLISWN